MAPSTLPPTTEAASSPAASRSSAAPAAVPSGGSGAPLLGVHEATDLVAEALLEGAWRQHARPHLERARLYPRTPRTRHTRGGAAAPVAGGEMLASAASTPSVGVGGERCPKQERGGYEAYQAPIQEPRCVVKNLDAPNQIQIQIKFKTRNGAASKQSTLAHRAKSGHRSCYLGGYLAARSASTKASVAATARSVHAAWPGGARPSRRSSAFPPPTARAALVGAPAPTG